MRNAAVGITLGNTQAATAGINASANNQVGAAYLAGADGTLNYITILGNTSTDYTTNYRLCIYAATSETVWSGALLGETAVQSVLNHNSSVKAALISSVSITAGNWYAITIQTETTLSTGTIGAAGAGANADRFFADTYSNGALATALASAANSGNSRCIYASSG